MPASQRTQKHIWGLFAARCAICKEHLIERAGATTALTGEVAHIVGEKPGSPRGQNSMNLAERNQSDNLMLLCLRHHKIIDDNDAEYTVGRLHDIRASYLAWLHTQLVDARPWKVGISQYAYLNVPRLDEFANIAGFSVHHPPIPDGKNLRSFGYELTAIMASYRRTLERLSIDALAADDIQFVNYGYVGELISFDRLTFRTRNMPFYRPAADNTFSGDPETDPHIYRAFSGWRLIINVNPRWVTTDTAYCMFRPQGGASTFTGFARINHVDYGTQTMTATGLAIGIPGGRIFSELADSTQMGYSKLRSIDLVAFEDEVSTGRNGYFTPEPDACDLCGRHFSTQTYMIDGELKHARGWACMCSECFVEHGNGLGIGFGQLYRKMSEGWRLVGGYPEPEEIEGE